MGEVCHGLQAQRHRFKGTKDANANKILASDMEPGEDREAELGVGLSQWLSGLDQLPIHWSQAMTRHCQSCISWNQEQDFRWEESSSSRISSSTEFSDTWPGLQSYTKAQEGWAGRTMDIVGEPQLETWEEREQPGFEGLSATSGRSIWSSQMYE